MKTNESREAHYRVDVVSMNRDGGYDLQHSTEFETEEEARACYEAEELGTETDKVLVDVWNDTALEATNEALL